MEKGAWADFSTSCGSYDEDAEEYAAQPREQAHLLRDQEAQHVLGDFGEGQRAKHPHARVEQRGQDRRCPEDAVDADAWRLLVEPRRHSHAECKVEAAQREGARRRLKPRLWLKVWQLA